MARDKNLEEFDVIIIISWRYSSIHVRMASRGQVTVLDIPSQLSVGSSCYDALKTHFPVQDCYEMD